MATYDPTGSQYFMLPNYGVQAANVGAQDPVSAYQASAAQPAATSLVSPTTLSSILGAAPAASTINPAAPPASNALGMNTGTMGLVLGGLQTIGSLWSAWQQNRLAQKQFNFQKDVTNTNMRNQIQSYNTTLASQAATRGSYEGWSDNRIDNYVDKNKLHK